MTSRTLRLAIVSDLHCHPRKINRKEEGDDSTYLLSDKLRVPSNDHPVESLLRTIKSENLSADYTLCPGDFTDKASVAGFIAGWNYSLEISRALYSREIIATLGNHDVDSYGGFSTYSLEIAKGIRQGFPIADEKERDTFWSKGCVFVERDDLRLLLINSSHYHYNKLCSGSGKVGEDLLEYVEEYLGTIDDEKIFIAMSHHHPIDHSRLKLGEEDKIINGDELLNILGKFRLDLFIHGHKHDPLLRYHPTSKGNFRIPIFSAGSFSSSSNLMFTSVRNSFHLLEIQKQKTSSGTVKTWTFFPNNGWSLNLDESGFAPISGFGNENSVQQVFETIAAMLDGLDKLDWNEVKQSLRDVENLIPSDSSALSKLLKSSGYLLDEHIWKGPSLIFNTNKQ